MALSPTPNDQRVFNYVWRRLLVLAGLTSEAADQNFPFQLVLGTGSSSGVTTEPITFYVETTGNDGNDGLDASRPCRTIQGALSKVPRAVQHLVTIRVGLGSFAGWHWQGFSVTPIASTAAGINILGTLATATLASGSATGTLTSFTAGSIAPVAYSVVTDTTQNWPVDGLKDLIFEYTTAAGALAHFSIISNTTTTITVANTSITIPSNAAYTIRDWGTVVDTTFQYAASIGSNPSAARIAGVFMSNLEGPATGISYQLDSIKFNLSSGTGILVTGCNANIQAIRCRCDNVAGAGLAISGPSTFTYTRGVLKGTTSAATSLTSDRNPLLTLSFATLRSAAGNGAILGGGVFLASTVYLEGAGIGYKIQEPGIYEFSGCKIANISSQGIRMRHVSGGYTLGVQVVFSGGVDISNTGTAIEVLGPNNVIMTSTATGTGNTIGIDVRGGGKVTVSAASTLTGTTEVILDNTATTLAAMRAANPKILTNVYGSAIYE